MLLICWERGWGLLRQRVACARQNNNCNLSLSCRDNLRGFFEHCFPGLIKRIFGYDDFEQSWLAIVSKVCVLLLLSACARAASGGGVLAQHLLSFPRSTRPAQIPCGTHTHTHTSSN